MPVWLERLVMRNVGVEFLPVMLCIGAAVVVWWWQWGRGKARVRTGGACVEERGGPALRVGWGPGMAVVALVLLGVAAFTVKTGIGVEAWATVVEDPWLAAWWVMGVGAAVMVWGVAAHAWRAEGRLARQCRRCRYDMTGVPGLMKCPECGRVARSERQLRPVNVRRWALWIGAVVVALGLVMPTAITVLNRGWAASLPDWALVRWALATNDPPEGVMVELNARARNAPDRWQGQLSAHRDELALRLLTAPATTRLLYSSLLQLGGTGITSPVVVKEAQAAVRSADIERRRAGLTVMVMSGGGRIPFTQIAPLLTDSDPVTAQNALWIAVANRDAYLVELAPPGGARDTESIRQLMRAITISNTFYLPPTDNYSTLQSDPDPETAARATLLGLYASQHQEHQPSELVRRAVLAAATLDAAGPNQRSQWLDPVRYYSKPDVAASMRTMINDPDPAVRRALFTQMEALSALYPGNAGSMDGSIKASRTLEEFLPVLRERLRAEVDPGAKQLLQKLVDSIEGKPEPQQTP